jgi:hypothetical protein
MKMVSCVEDEISTSRGMHPRSKQWNTWQHLRVERQPDWSERMRVRFGFDAQGTLHVFYRDDNIPVTQ